MGSLLLVIFYEFLWRRKFFNIGSLNRAKKGCSKFLLWNTVHETSFIIFGLTISRKTFKNFRKNQFDSPSPSKAAENSHQFDVRGKLESVTWYIILKVWPDIYLWAVDTWSKTVWPRCPPRRRDRARYIPDRIRRKPSNIWNWKICNAVVQFLPFFAKTVWGSQSW